MREHGSNAVGVFSPAGAAAGHTTATVPRALRTCLLAERACSVRRAVHGVCVKLTVSKLFEGGDSVVKRQHVPATTPALASDWSLGLPGWHRFDTLERHLASLDPLGKLDSSWRGLLSRECECCPLRPLQHIQQLVQLFCFGS